MLKVKAEKKINNNNNNKKEKEKNKLPFPLTSPQSLVTVMRARIGSEQTPIPAHPSLTHLI